MSGKGKSARQVLAGRSSSGVHPGGRKVGRGIGPARASSGASSGQPQGVAKPRVPRGYRVDQKIAKYQQNNDPLSNGMDWVRLGKLAMQVVHEDKWLKADGKWATHVAGMDRRVIVPANQFKAIGAWIEIRGTEDASLLSMATELAEKKRSTGRHAQFKAKMDKSIESNHALQKFAVQGGMPLLNDADFYLKGKTAEESKNAKSSTEMQVMLDKKSSKLTPSDDGYYSSMIDVRERETTKQATLRRKRELKAKLAKIEEAEEDLLTDEDRAKLQQRKAKIEAQLEKVRKSIDAMLEDEDQEANAAKERKRERKAAAAAAAAAEDAEPEYVPGDADEDEDEEDGMDE